MKKQKKILSLNKLTISRLNNFTSIMGGTGAVIAGDVVTRKTRNEDVCPLTTTTCPDDPELSSYIFDCGCGTQVESVNC